MDIFFAELQWLNAWLNFISGLVLLIGAILTGFWAYTKFILERGFLPPTEFFIEGIKIGSEKQGVILKLLIHIKNLGTSALVVNNLRIVDIRYLTSTNTPSYFTSKETLQDIQKNVAKVDEAMLRNPNKTIDLDKQRKKIDEEKIKVIRRQMAKLGRLKFQGSLIKDINPDFLNSNPTVAEILTKQNKLRKHRKKPKEIEIRGVRIVPWDTFVQPGVDQVYPYATVVPLNTKYVMVSSSFQYGQIPSKAQQIIIKISRRLGLIQYSLTHLREPRTAETIFSIE